MKRYRLLRMLLISILIGSNILIFVLSGYSLFESRKQDELHAATLTQNIANALDQNVSNSIEKIGLTLRTMVDELEHQLLIKKIDEKAMNTFLAKHELRLPVVDAFRVASSDGRVFLNIDPNGGRNANWADRAFFSYHQQHADNTLQISKPVWNEFAKQYSIVLSRRYNYPDGNFAGVVTAEIALDSFTLLLSQFDLGPNGTIILRYTDLGLIARFPPISNRPAGQVGNSEVSKELRQLAESGTRTATTYHTQASSDGVERTFTYRRLEGTPIIVTAGVAPEDYLADWRSEVQKTTLMAFGTFLLSLLLGGFLFHLFNRVVRESNRNQIFLKCASDGIQIMDEGGKFIEVNDRLCSMLAYDRDELLGMNVTECLVGWPPRVLLEKILPELLASSEPSTIETQLRRKNGVILDVEANISSFTLDSNKYIYVSVRDIAERKQVEEQIRNLAYYDSLTELPNRRLMMDRLSRALVASDRSQAFGALMILDLDNFKVLNDTQGHDVGDRLLFEVAQRLLLSIRKEDTVSRFGGDEYVVMVEDLGVEERLAANQAEMIAEKIRSTLNLPYAIYLGEMNYHSSASIGVTLFRGQALSMDVLLKQADLALYQAKGGGRNSIRFFDPEMQAAIDSHSAMEVALRNALQQGEFQIYYQPQIDQYGKLTGAEALLRWRHVEYGLVSPAMFIPLAEETGLISPIGDWVLRMACTQLKIWSENPRTRDLQIAVNVSASQFRQPEFLNCVQEALRDAGANPTLLKLELTESVVLDQVDAVIGRMYQIKDLGVTFSLDDFGTGFSSLSYLKRLPLDQVKIDQSFVRDIDTDPSDAAIVRAIIAMTRSLGMQVIAEGVETEAQLHFLRDSGCMNYQGYLFGKPMPIHEWDQFLLRPQSDYQQKSRILQKLHVV